MFDFSTPITKDYTFRPVVKCGPNYDSDVLLVIKQTGGNGQATMRDIWGGDITVNGTTVSNSNTIVMNFDEGGDTEVVFKFSNPSTPRTWNQYASFVESKTVEFEFVWMNVDAVINDAGALPSKAFYRFFYGTSNSSNPCVTIAKNAFDFSNVISIGTNNFYEFFAYQSEAGKGITKIPDGLFYFPNVTSVTSSGAFSSMMGGSSPITTIGKNNFVFPSLESMGDGFNDFALNNKNITTIEEDCFQFTALKTIPRIGNYMFNSSFKGSTLLSIGKGSFLFPSVESTAQKCFGQTFYGCNDLTALPIGSFNWPMNITAVGYFTGFGDEMLDNSGVASPGNGLTKINCPFKVWNNVLPQVEAGEIWEVNGE